jgi:ATP-dependent helicase/nuclease subunit A
MPDAQARHAAAARIDLHVLLESGAGCGKTAALVQRYLRILQDDPHADVDNIAAITFTNRAAREMKSRLRNEFLRRFCAAQSRGDVPRMRLWRDRLRSLQTAPIGTIHSFCTSLLRQYPLAANLDPRFAVLDEVQAAVQLPRVVKESLLAGLTENRPAARVIGHYGSLTEATQAITALLRSAEKYRQPLKHPPSSADLLRQWQNQERTEIEQRFAKLEELPAYQQLMRLLHDEGLLEKARAHAEDKLAQRVMELDELLQPERFPTTPDELRAWATHAKTCLGGVGNLGAANYWGGPAKLKQKRAALNAALLQLRETLRTLALDPDTVTSASPLTSEIADLAAAIWQEAHAALAAWAAYKASLPALDFYDQQALLWELLQNHPDLRRHIQRRFRHLLVDEFQDTNRLQRDIIWTLAGLGPSEHDAELAPSDAHAKLFVVGDAKQSIYRFRDADVSVYAHARAEFTTQPGRAHYCLTTSFRPNQALMDFFNRLFPQEQMLPVRPAQPDFEASYHEMQAVRAEVPIRPAVMGILVASEHEDAPVRRNAEAHVIAAFLKHLLELQPPVFDHRTGQYVRLQPGHIAILFRAMTEAYLYEDALLDAGLPFYNASGRGFFARPEVTDLVNLLRVLTNPDDALALVGVLRSPLFALSDLTLFWLSRLPGKWWTRVLAAAGPAPAAGPAARVPAPEYARLRRAAQLLQSWHRRRDRLPISALLQEVIEQTGYSAALAAQSDGRRAVANLGKLLDFARSFEARPGQGLDSFVRLLADLADADLPESQAPTEEEEGVSIRLSSIHAAKGLQWPVVVVADLGRDRPGGQEIAKTYLHPRWGLVPGAVDEQGNEQASWLAKVIAATNRAEEEAEERRLLYVALTRAGDLLVMTSSARAKQAAERHGAGDAGLLVALPRRGWLSALLQACGYGTGPWRVPQGLGLLQPLGSQAASSAPPAPEGPGGEQLTEGPSLLCPWYVVPEGCGELPPLQVELPAAAVASAAAASQPSPTTPDTPAAPPPSAPAPPFAALLTPVPPDSASRARFTVTELAAYVFCPEFYRLRHVEGLPDVRPRRPTRQSRLSALQRGELAHRLLQMVGSGGLPELERFLGPVVGGGALLRLGPKDLQELRELLAWFLCDDFYTRTIAAARRLRTEAWLSVVFDGALVEGRVDAAVETGDGLILVDYKTGAAPAPVEDEAGLDLDRFQLSLYSFCLHKVTRQWPREAVVVYLAERRLERLTLPHDAEAAAQRAQRAIAAIRAGLFPPAPDDSKCGPCRLRWACKASRISGRKAERDS